MAFLVLLIAVLSRVLPHLLHLTGANVTMVGAGVLFFGAGLRRGQRAWSLLAVALLAATDYWLTVYAYGFPFHFASYLPTWLWYGGVCLGASVLLHRRRSVLRVGAAALTSSTGFFLLSNGVVWMRSGMYPHTSAGLGQCYAAGLPFYRNDLASTLVFSAVFFSLPLLATALRGAADSLQDHGAGTI
ncbi:MAG: DUF6580 family putative transport protein [Janthinobacterium lividum]